MTSPSKKLCFRTGRVMRCAFHRSLLHTLPPLFFNSFGQQSYCPCQSMLSFWSQPEISTGLSINEHFKSSAPNLLPATSVSKPFPFLRQLRTYSTFFFVPSLKVNILKINAEGNWTFGIRHRARVTSCKSASESKS